MSKKKIAKFDTTPVNEGFTEILRLEPMIYQHHELIRVGDGYIITAKGFSVRQYTGSRGFIENLLELRIGKETFGQLTAEQCMIKIYGGDDHDMQTV